MKLVYTATHPPEPSWSDLFAARRFTQRAIAQMAEHFGMDATYLEGAEGSVRLVCEGPPRYARALYNNLTIQNVVGFELYCDGGEYEELVHGPDAAYLKPYAEVVLVGPSSPALEGGEDAFLYDKRTLREVAEGITG